jgi:glutamate synthase (NADPH) small chain
VAKPTGFMEYKRENASYRPVTERVRDYKEVDLPLIQPKVVEQATRCMDCGIPTCHGIGCPVKNRIPEFNDLVRLGRWKEAAENLHSTNNFPEVTGRVCPAPCEPACTLSINDDPVTIKHIEFQIAERAWAEGWVVPEPPSQETGYRVAVVGSGPAGLAAAQQLRRAGHQVTVFEMADRIGGLLRYGIPDFKLAKQVVDRRVRQMEAEGVEFQAGVNVGVDISARYLEQMFDATVLAIGAMVPRDVVVPGRDEASNVVFAMNFLTQQNKLNAGDAIDPNDHISAAGKRVVVIGGGDTGSDCVGTSIRQGAREVHQVELLEMPPEQISPDQVWPLWPKILRTSSSHEEGCQRQWSINTKGFVVENGEAKQLKACRVDWVNDPKSGRPQMREVPDSEFAMDVDLVLLAAGFVHVEQTGIVKQLDLEMNERGNVQVSNYHTSRPGIFAAGDAQRGASLVVYAINEGREAAEAVDVYLHTQVGKPRRAR